MITFNSRLLVTCCAVSVLGACVSSTETPDVAPDEDAVVTSVTPSSGTEATTAGTTPSTGFTYATLAAITDPAALVTVVSQDSGTRAGTVDATARFNGSSNVVTVGGASVNEAASNLTAGLSYVGAIGGGSDNKFFLVPTQAPDMPTGSATYTGLASVVVPVAANSANDGVYAGQMNSSLTVTFDPTSTSSQLALSNLTDGQVTTTANPTPQTYTSTGSENVTFNNLSVSGTTITQTGTTGVSVTGFGGAAATPSTSGASVDVAGAFAGPQAAEVAGAAGVNGSTVGGLSVIFTGKK